MSHGVPSVARCGLLLFMTKLALRLRGFDWTITWLRRRMERVPETIEPCLEFVRATEYAVAMAGAFYPGRTLCLEQSLTLYYLLRREGIAVKYRQGVQITPFAAHAWIEYHGTPVNDVPEHVREYIALGEQLP